MARRSPYITVLQFGSNYIAFLRVRPKGEGVDVESHGVQRGAWNAEDGSLQDAIAGVLDTNGLAADRIVTVLPRHEAALRTLELPSQDPKELAGMVHLGAEDIVPFPVDELHTSYCVLNELPDGASRVLAVVVRKAVLTAHLDVLRAAGIEPEQVLLSTTCLLTALARQENTDDPTAVVHVAPDGLELLIVREGTLAFGRGVAIDFGGGELDARGREDLVAEFRASLATYRRESHDGLMPSALTVSADGFDAGALAGALQEEVDVPVHAADSGAASWVALGAAYVAAGDRKYLVGLLPEAEVRRRAAASTRMRGLRLAAMAAAALVATAAAYGQALYQRHAYLDQLEQHADELRPVARSLRTKRQQLRILSEQIDRSRSPLHMLGTIVELAPDKNLNLRRYLYNRDDGIILNGSAVKPALFDAFIDDLRKEGSKSFAQFARAQELYRNARRERNREVWDFAVTIPFSGDQAGD